MTTASNLIREDGVGPAEPIAPEASSFRLGAGHKLGMCQTAGYTAHIRAKVKTAKSRVGILALQGCVTPHCDKISSLGADPVRIVSADQLHEIDAIILPGGESTTMLKFLSQGDFFTKLQEFCRTHPTWGVCAGSILLAQEVKNPAQTSLKLLPIRAWRNYYGSQRESFELELEFLPLRAKIPAQFIRAPLLEPIPSDPRVTDLEVLCRFHDVPVCLRYKNIIVSSFHTELGLSSLLHRYFLEAISP